MNADPSPREITKSTRKTLETIPRAMRQMGWTVSAQLMERWLHSPAWVLPPEWKDVSPPDPRRLSASQLDQRAVTMRWALSHGRVRDALNSLRIKMANGPAKANLRRRIANARWGADNRTRIGGLQHAAVDLEATCQANYELFGTMGDVVDDLYGSLGAATLKVALIGEARRERSTGKITMQVTHAGFYIRDTYDFNGFQYLGTWTENGVLGKRELLMNMALDGMVFRWSGEPIGNVYNHDFDKYRRLTGFGGDFIIYSDVHWERTDMLLELG